MECTFNLSVELVTALKRASNISGKSLDELVAHAVQMVMDKDSIGDRKPLTTGWVSVIGRYKGRSYPGTLNPETGETKLDYFGERVFPRPSPAAIALKEKVNPELKNPNTDGLAFFVVSETGKRVREAFPELRRK